MRFRGRRLQGAGLGVGGVRTEGLGTGNDWGHEEQGVGGVQTGAGGGRGGWQGRF